jgi:pimeloyl-ACP methyl ester carboxylesterase
LTAVLVHGMTADSRSWWQVAPRLAALGYRVLAPDLPGHGASFSDPKATVESFVDALCDALPVAPDLAVGHSAGGSILRAAQARLQARRLVYVDTPLRPPVRRSRAELLARYTAMKAQRSETWLRATRSHWDDGDVRVEAAAARLWDPATAAALSADAGGRPARAAAQVPTLFVLADGSETVSIAEQEALARGGARIVVIPGAGHTVWYGHVDEFVEAVAAWASSDSDVDG